MEHQSSPVAVPDYRSPWAVPLAVLAHVGLVAGLLLSVAWKSEPAPALQAELWEAIPTTAAPMSKAVDVKPPEVKPPETPPPAPEIEPAPDAIAPKQVKPDPKPELKKPVKAEPKPEPKPKLEPTSKPVPEPTAKPEPKVTPKPDTAAQKEAAREAARQKEIARMNQLLGGAPVIAPAASQAGTVGGLGQGWGAKLKACVQPNLRYNDTAGDNPRVVVLVKLSPTGSPSDPVVSKPSGNAAFDAAVMRALLRCDPFPKPESGAFPTSLAVTYRLND